MNSASLLYTGRMTQERRSGHTNPSVKLLLLGAPLLFVIYQQVGRLLGWPRLSSSGVLLLALGLYWASILNFRDRELPRTVQRAIIGALFFGGLFIVATYPYSAVATALGFLSAVYHAIPIVRGTAPESWLYLIFFYIAIVAVKNFTTRDSLWIGRRLLLWWTLLYTVYVVVVITFCVIHSALPLRLRLSWSVASDKAALLRNPYRYERLAWTSRMVSRWRLFALTLIGSYSAIAQAIELLCEQRGFFRIGYSDGVGRSLAAEDVVALMLVALVVVSLIIYRF